MQTADFNYVLPDELIARYPTKQRTQSRLMAVSAAGDIQHQHFSDILQHLHRGDLLVVNNTQVIAARLFGKKESGGKLEILIERLLDEHTVLAHVRSSRSPKEGAVLSLFTDESMTQQSPYRVQMNGRHETLFELSFEQPVLNVLNEIGHMPLPPYIDRADELDDKERYQTVYAKNAGAVAAPTAGLHFDEALLQALAEKGVEKAELTLHVGAGTFQPVKVDNIHEHTMHSEWIEVDEKLCQQVRKTKAAGGRVIAVGTTAVRSLETASLSGSIQAFCGDTDIFLYPGKAFHCVDAMITNFHLPQSTLLMLVSAFSGSETIKKAYQEAVQKQYRFFSYGDAMFLNKQQRDEA